MIKSHAKKQSPAPIVIGWIVTTAVILFYAYEYLLRLAPSPMYDYFATQFHATAYQIGLIDSAYYWAYIPMQILVGTIMDILGVRKPMFLAVLSCIAGTFLYSLPHSLTLVLLGRMLIGFGSSFGFVAVLKTATLWLPKRLFPLAVGIATSMGMLGAISGISGISILINIFDIETTLQITLGIGFAIFAITYLCVYDKKSRARRSHTKKRIKIVEQTLSNVLSNPQIWLAGTIGLALYLPTQIFGLWGIPYFEHVHDMSRATALKVSPLILWGWLVGGPLVGILCDYVKNRRMILITGSFLTFSTLALLLYMPMTQLNHIIPAMFFMGVFSSVQILVFDIAASSSKRSQAGTAVAVTNMIIMLGGAIQPFIGSLIESMSTDGALFSAEGFNHAFLIMPITCLLAFFLTFLLKDLPSHD
ncbi:MFS transporter [Candidatus Synchoanobacter obligatus]|uniref:Lysosomal dipeptide transporter MFSD1 n=1 Tax=Candidatus Synchoanobacter obligatus TaxID=2919597 RepID=A0ABT1L5N7_9GAMM|nr:MFS transporter [Candidatus Synchoanobacter obligatus]MCP8351763.1 MFS transporter [Candidatus Synchoanobacter obligatus]